MDQADLEWSPTQRQLDRVARSKAILDAAGIPQYWTPLFVNDESEVELQTPDRVAQRAMVLWVVARTAEGVVSRVSAASFLHSIGLAECLSPAERSFLDGLVSGNREVNRFVWRLEALVALLWALGQIDALYWPDRLCQGRLLEKVMGADLALSPILEGAKLRPKSEVMDEQDLAMKQNWAARNTMRSVGLPGDATFVYKKPGAGGLLGMRRGKTRLNMGVVAERHYALNWLTNHPSPAGWDEIDTPT